MIDFSGTAILLDIEGTTSSVRFVYDTMFPYARRELEAYLAQAWDEPATHDACRLVAVDAGYSGLDEWAVSVGVAVGDAAAVRELVQAEVIRLMDGDIKATGLKQLQGLIWRAGFESGEMQAHLYPDVTPALQAWNEAGLDIHIYSSGSVAAQKLFFGHTIEGDLLPRLRGHYDTTTGPKKESDSYRLIAADIGQPAERILFLSDVVAELDAAAAAGFQTGLSLRPENAPVDGDHAHAAIHSFAEVTARRLE